MEFGRLSDLSYATSQEEIRYKHTNRQDMRFIALSDTHGWHEKVVVPDGDVLLFAGDMCSSGTLREVERFGNWLRTQPHRHKIVIAGNHDWPFQREEKTAREALGEGVVYLQDQSVNLDGVLVYGSPWQPEFCRWAFNLPRGDALRKIWSKIPDQADVLLTHGPPHGILDQTFDRRLVGCEALRERLDSLPRLKLHVFGHIHEAYGKSQVGARTYLNASACDLSQRFAANSVWIVDLSL